jgi:hypothetical protein
MKPKKNLTNILAYLILFTIMTFGVYAQEPAVNLGTAGNFTILAKSGISNTGTTTISGDIGVSPIDSTAITGFALTLDSSTQFSTSSIVDGKVYAADYSLPTPGKMTTAINDMEAAYTNALGRFPPVTTELGSGNIGGMLITPGIYKWSTNVGIANDITLIGNSTDVWIFQIAGNLVISSAKKVILSGGAQAKNVFWVVAGQTTLGTTSVFNGIILDEKAIVFNTGATLCGRAFAQTAVTLDSNTIITTCGAANETTTTTTTTSTITTTTSTSTTTTTTTSSTTLPTTSTTTIASTTTSTSTPTTQSEETTTTTIPSAPEFPSNAAPILILGAVTLGAAVMAKRKP